MSHFKKLQKFYDLLIPGKTSEEMFTWESGIPHFLFNAIMIDQPVDLNNVNPHFSIWISDRVSNQQLPTGFAHAFTCPLMTWKPKQIKNASTSIQKADLKEFCDILSSTFQFDEEVKKKLTKVMDVPLAENYLLRKLATGTLIIHEKTAAIFNIAVLPEHQRLGYGKTLMRDLMNRAFELQMEEVILLSSPNAVKFYSDLGFEEKEHIKIYTKI